MSERNLDVGGVGRDGGQEGLVRGDVLFEEDDFVLEFELRCDDIDALDFEVFAYRGEDENARVS